MYVSDPNSPVYSMMRPPRQEKDSKWYKNKYTEEGAYDLAHDLATKVVFSKEPMKFFKDFRNGALLGRPVQGIASGYKYGLQGTAMFTLPMTAYSMASAPRGKKLANGLGTLVGSLTGATIGGVLGGPVGALIGGALLSPSIERGVSRGLTSFADYGRSANNPNYGGRYEDTPIAYTMRQRAAMEIGSSLMSARQHLGNEAMLTHQ